MSDELFERQNAGGVVRAAKQLAALAEETRLSIMVLLHAGGPESVSNLGTIIGRPFASISHHLQYLSAAGLVESAKSGREQLYRVHPDIRCESVDGMYLGGFRLEGFELMMLAPPAEEAAPAPAAEAAPKPARRKRGA